MDYKMILWLIAGSLIGNIIGMLIIMYLFK